jgi:hypothetical protein
MQKYWNTGKRLHIYLYSPTVDNTFLSLVCSTRFGDYTTVTRRCCQKLVNIYIYIYILENDTR